MTMAADPRGTKQQRGYTAQHDKARSAWVSLVEAGIVVCARCETRISAGDAWHLDHTSDRLGYLGPSHAACNVRAAQSPPRARPAETHPGIA